MVAHGDTAATAAGCHGTMQTSLQVDALWCLCNLLGLAGVHSHDDLKRVIPLLAAELDTWHPEHCLLPNLHL